MKKQLRESKKSKLQISFFILAAVFILILLLIVGYLLFQEYQKTFYPKDVLEKTTDEESTYMQSSHFRSLYHVALDLSSVGFEIYPYDTSDQIYHYDSKVYNRIFHNLSEGSVFLIGRGTGDIVDDVVADTEYLYSFLGDVEPEYTEVHRESGYYNHYQAVFSTGRLTPNNFFRKGDFYISSMEFRIKEDLWVLFIYTADDVTDLKRSTDLIKSMANSMFQGADVAEDEENDSAETGDGAQTKSAPEEDTKKTPGDTSYNNATIKDMVKTDIAFNENVDEWAVAFAKETDLAHADYNDMDEPVSGVKQFLTVTQLQSNTTREICFVAKVKSGKPLHAVLFSPDGMSYYEPTRYEESGEYYFYVTNPENGIWKCVLEIQDCDENIVSLNWHGITSDEDRDYYLLPAAPYVTEKALEVIEGTENPDMVIQNDDALQNDDEIEESYEEFELDME